jgi:streptomycin 6-kinase
MTWAQSRPTPSIRLPERVSVAVAALGLAGQRWLAGLPELVSSLEADWTVTCGTALDGGNAAYVAEAVTADGQLAVLKIALPPGIDGFAPFEQELQALQDAGGDPYARLICHDGERRSMLLERLGRPLASLGWPTDRQISVITATLARGWRAASSGRLPTGAAKAEWLADFIGDAWRDLGEPCTERAVTRAIDYAAERASRVDPRNAVLVHGDAHPANVLEVPDGTDSSTHQAFRLVDPEGLASEPAHDLGVVLRGWNEDLLAADAAAVAFQRCRAVSRRTGVDPESIWQWSYIERASTGLFLLRLGHEAEARLFLEAADRLGDSVTPWPKITG